MKEKIWSNNKLNLSDTELEKMMNAKNSEEEIIQLFKIIKSRNKIKYDWDQNSSSDGLLGNIFEYLIGVRENNYRKPDYNDFEIKTKNEKSSSMISLFCYSLNCFESVNSIIREKYGSLDKKSFLNVFNSTIKYSIWNSHKSGHNFKLEKCNNKLFLRIKDSIKNTLIDEDKYFWDVNVIQNLFKKIKNCCYVEGEIDKENKIVIFKKMIIYKFANINNFWKLLINGDVTIDFRLGVYKSGKRIGQTHDHGTTFRIKKSKISELYDYKKEII